MPSGKVLNSKFTEIVAALSFRRVLLEANPRLKRKRLPVQFTALHDELLRPVIQCFIQQDLATWPSLLVAGCVLG